MKCNRKFRLAGVFWSLVWGAIISSRADYVEHSSFQAPFDEFDVRGSRRIPGFRVGGNASIKQNFLRLTDEKPEQRGWLYSTRLLDGEEFSAILKFRVSGRSEQGNGDFLALWVSAATTDQEGPAYGLPHDSPGIGIILDPFWERNGAPKHRDIRLIINDGNSSLSSIHEDTTGCISSFRFDERKDSFSAAGLASRVRLAYGPKGATVDVDARGAGRWRTCARVAGPPGMPEGWWRWARVGLLAETSGFSNNQDILSLHFWNTADGAHASNESLVSPEEEIGELQTLVHDFEHAVEAIKNDIEETLSKLDKEEKTSQERIASLEERMQQKIIEETLGRLAHEERSSQERITALETRVQQRFDIKLDERLRRLEQSMSAMLNTQMLDKVRRFEHQVKHEIDDKVDHGIKEANKSWQVSYVVLAASLFSTFYWGYKRIMGILRWDVFGPGEKSHRL